MTINKEAVHKFCIDAAIAAIITLGSVVGSIFSVVKDAPQEASFFFDYMSKFGFAFFGFVMTTMAVTLNLIDKEKLNLIKTSPGAHDDLWGVAKRSMVILFALSILSLVPLLFRLKWWFENAIFFIALGLASLAILSIRRVVVNLFGIIQILRESWVNS